MKRASILILSCGALLALAAFGCRHLDVQPEGNPNRVLSGTVNVAMSLVPPPDTEVLVRLIEPSEVKAESTALGKDLVIGERGTMVRPEVVVAEQVITSPREMPAPFALEFAATDAQLRHGLNLEARISYGGKVRFRTVEAVLVTLEDVGTPQRISLEPVR